MNLPRDFLLGAATSAYQIEGAVSKDGRGPSIWDAFCAVPGKVLEGQTGAIACDHYHRFEDDVRLLADLGFRAYRFSVSWSRILPHGTGHVNQAGLDFYSRLVDTLLAHGVEPWLTLYHWDLPLTLERNGGWRARDTARAFADYARIVAHSLGDRVRHWMTLNEPWCSAILGHETGEHAPGERLDRQQVTQVIHHLLLAHGLGVQALRAENAGQVGLVMVPPAPMPLEPDAAHRRAADAAWRDQNDWWFLPLYAGQYPADLWDRAAGDVPRLEDGDLEAISSPTDFLGLNVYFPTFVRPSGVSYEDCTWLCDLPRTAMNWPVYPQVLAYVVSEVHRRYRPGPIYITENGCATEDEPQGGRVHDHFRVEYLRAHLTEAVGCAEEGLPVRGFFAWSLLDNFEWQFGNSRRFGITHVDFATQKRTPKTSALYLRQVNRTRRLEPW